MRIQFSILLLLIFTGVVAVLLFLFIRPKPSYWKNENRVSYQAQSALKAEEQSWRPHGFDPGSNIGFVLRDRGIPSKTIPSDGERFLEVMFQLPSNAQVGQQFQLKHVTRKPSVEGETRHLTSGECICHVYARPHHYPAKTSSVEGRAKVEKLGEAWAVIHVKFSAEFEGEIGMIAVDRNYTFLP